jgi:hypothetical protein
LEFKFADEEVRGAEHFLRSDNRALPEAFTEQDILLSDKKFFSDNYVILLKYKLAQDALNVYVVALSSSIHPEVRKFYKTILNQTAELVDLCIKLMIKSGMHQPLIHVPKNQEVEKVQDQTFLGMFFGKDRPLSVVEVLQLTSNYQSTEVFREILLFLQQCSFLRA